MANALSVSHLSSVRVASPGFVDLTWDITRDNTLIGGLDTVFDPTAISAAFDKCEAQRKRFNTAKDTFMLG